MQCLAQLEVYYNSNMDLLDEFSSNMKLPASLKKSILDYFFYKTQSSSNYFYDTEAVLGILSPYVS